MKIIMGGRKTGRTSLLIHQAAQAQSCGENCYIVCANTNAADNISQRAKELGLNINYPITFDELLRGNGIHGKEINHLLIDNADHLLQSLSLGVPIKVISLEREVDDDEA